MREVQALKNVNFRIKRGAVYGVVGANGAGKSTLMRTVTGILPPTEGRVEVKGRVSTLLALGVGFNKELTGRENVVLGGLAAGLSREQIAHKYDEIVDFAELEDFMDMPMRTYSSGMYGRLALRGRRQHGARHPRDRRGPLGRRRALQEEVVREDEAARATRTGRSCWSRTPWGP